MTSYLTPNDSRVRLDARIGPYSSGDAIVDDCRLLQGAPLASWPLGFSRFEALVRRYPAASMQAAAAPLHLGSSRQASMQATPPHLRWLREEWALKASPRSADSLHATRLGMRKEEGKRRALSAPRGTHAMSPHISPRSCAELAPRGGPGLGRRRSMPAASVPAVPRLSAARASSASVLWGGARRRTAAACQQRCPAASLIFFLS